MITQFKQWLRRWNRQRLANRQLEKARQHKASINLAQRRQNLGSTIAGPLPRIAWGILIGDASTDEQARCHHSVTTACAITPGLADSLVLTGDDHQAMMADAFAAACDVYIALNARGALHPDALTALLQMHMAANGSALIDATLFPRQHPKSFDANSYDTPWAHHACVLIPRSLFERTRGFDSSKPTQHIEIDWSKQAKTVGFQIKTCPTALFFMPSDQPAADKLGTTDRLSIVCRFHDASRISELKRAVFSVACSTYPDIELLIVTQNFDSSEVANVRNAIAPIAEPSQTPPSIRLINHPCAADKDARTELLNLGIAQATGRYLAFLDHDDVIYPEAYELLIGELIHAQVAIAFGGIITKHFECFDQVIQLRKSDPLNQQGSLSALFAMNCCPIHSYVIDKHRVTADDLKFDEQLVRYEDYEFLLRICAHHTSSFKHHRTAVGDYYMKDDGSNSTLYLSSSQSSTNQMLWLEAKKRVTQRKAEIFLSPEVLAQLNISDTRNPLSISEHKSLKSLQHAAVDHHH